ncbi:MAG: hypothetical protein WBN22_13340 [Verrucomicrobiia bacterium]
MLGPFATLIIGFGVIFIAWQQWKVSHAKLRLDLFDRRYKVYEATRKLLAGIMSDATFSDSQLFTFYAGTSDVEFLFDKDVVDYLEQIRKRALHMRLLSKTFQPLPVGDERSRLVNEESAEMLWLTHQIMDMAKVFSPYLGFANIK